MEKKLRSDELGRKGYRILQDPDAFCFGVDAVLLADFAEIPRKARVLDLGTGNGILPLLLYGRGRGSRYYALEIQEEAAELARRNAELNGLEDRITVICADALEAARYIESCFVDAAVCNPPYGLPAGSLSSPKKTKATARNQQGDTLDHLCRGAFEILKGRGKLFLVYPAPQMLSVMEKLQAHHLEPKRFRMVYPYTDKPANLVLIEAVKDARPMLHPMPPLVVYRKDGTLTDELKSVYHIQEQTEF